MDGWMVVFVFVVLRAFPGFPWLCGNGFSFNLPQHFSSQTELPIAYDRCNG